MDLKVCLFPFLKSASGGASFGLELAKSLSHENVKVDIIAFDMDPKVRCDLSRRGVNVINIKYNPSTLEYVGGPLAAYYYYSECIGSIIDNLKTEEKFDVFHSVLAPASLTLRPTASLVVTAWNPLNIIENIKKRIVPLAFPKNFLGVPAIMEYEFMDRRAFKKAKYVTCGTSQVLSYVMKLQPAKAVLCYPPIDQTAFGLERKKNENKVKIAYVAKDLTNPRKGIFLFLRAIDELDLEIKRNIQITFVGNNGDSLYNIARSHLSEMEVNFIPYSERSEVLSILLSSDIYVNPSLFDDFSYALLEALACGPAVIASDIPAFREMTGNGEHACLFNAGDYKMLARGIEDLVRDRNKRLAKGFSLRNYVRHKYGSDNAVKSYLELYKRIVVDAERRIIY